MQAIYSKQRFSGFVPTLRWHKPILLFSLPPRMQINSRNLDVVVEGKAIQSHVEVGVSNAKENLIRSCRKGGCRKKWWLSLITNLPRVAPPHYPTPSFLIKISINHNTGEMKRSGDDDRSGMPMASLPVTAHCNWKLLLSGFVCSSNYNKLPAWHVVCTDVGH